MEKTRRQHTFPNHAKNPSFSSTLLDKIYRSIDEGERKGADMKFYTHKKQSRLIDEEEEEEEVEELTAASVRRACLVEKWIDRKASEKVVIQRGEWKTQTVRRMHGNHHDHEQDIVFFSSTSSSSDSSSGLLSSSDTESMIGLRSCSGSRVSCFAPSRPKPVRSNETLIGTSNEEGLIKSKSRALKIYNNLKKVKQPISPGGKLTNFLNSLFTTGNTKKSSKATHVNAERKGSSEQVSTCSSASSFARSCLSKNTSASSRDKVKRTVRFYPVSVIVDEDSRPCGHKCLYEGEDTRLMAVSVPTAWKIGRSPCKKNEEEEMEKNKPVEEAAREFLKEYRRNQRRSDLVFRDFPKEDEDEDEDAASCSSSELFELDHLTLMRNNRYCEELPVYETTHVSTNHAIANGLIM